MTALGPDHLGLLVYHRTMDADVLAATLVAPGRLELRRYPYPDRLEPGAVLIEMLASGICGTDKHTFRGETQRLVLAGAAEWVRGS